MELVPASDPFVGQTLQGRYRVLRKLGEGGMGAVYAGEHTMIKRQVALKVLLPHYARSQDVVARFLQEATVVTQLRHEHIVDVTDMGQLEDGSLFMVQELLEGSDFAHLIEREGAQPVGRTAHIVSQMCDALEAAHPNLVHRDLKPENVFLVRRRNDPYFVKILDFGIAKIVGGEDSTTAGRAKTKTGTAIGTVYYMSPEQASGAKTLDHRTDIYAIGAVLYRALTNTFAFEADSATMVLLKIMTEPPPSPRALRPDLPAELDALVLRCMAKSAADRFQTCAELRRALAPFVGLADAPIVVRGNAVGADAASAPTMDSGQAVPVASPIASAALAPSAATPLPQTTLPSRDGDALPTRRTPLYVALGVGGLLLVGGVIALALGAGSSTPTPPNAAVPSAPAVPARSPAPTPADVAEPQPEGPRAGDPPPPAPTADVTQPSTTRTPGSHRPRASTRVLGDTAAAVGTPATPTAAQTQAPVTPTIGTAQQAVTQPAQSPAGPTPPTTPSIGDLGQGHTRHIH